MRKGIAFVLSAPSGAGKSTLIALLRKEFPTISYSISCTTRTPRPGEVDGRDYYFLDRETFLTRRNQDYFAEWAEVHGNFYGTPLASCKAMLDEGRDVLFDIDVQGAAQLKLTMPSARFVFILPPSLEELERRLRHRGTDSEQSIEKRLSNARSELAKAHWYDALVLNDQLEKAYDLLRAVYLAATLAPDVNNDLLATILKSGE
ncbi:MAG: guanylate kinase [Desulfovibrio sp.]|nr:guanylate kinase [Desulfovibrio sp.]